MTAVEAVLSFTIFLYDTYNAKNNFASIAAALLLPGNGTI